MSIESFWQRVNQTNQTHFDASAPALVLPYYLLALRQTFQGYVWDFLRYRTNRLRRWFESWTTWEPSQSGPVWCRLISASTWTNRVMGNSNAGNGNKFWNQTIAASLIAIGHTTVSTTSKCQCRISGLMHGVSLGSDVHYGINCKSVIGFGKESQAETSQQVGSSLVLTLLKNVLRSRVVW